MENGFESLFQKIIDYNFDLKDEIARGGYGVVYKVELEDEVIALKEIFSNPLTLVDSVKLFLREVGNMEFAKHPCIVEIKGWNIINKESSICLFYTMPFYEKSLSTFLNKQNTNMDLATKAIIIYGIARGMKYMHNLALTHRDIKPSNILINEDHEPLITDMGFSKILDNTGISRPTGTEKYLPPELSNNRTDNQYDPTKFDVYAFGLCMYEILVGLLKDKNEIIIDNNPNLNESQRNLIKETQKPNPSDRPRFEDIVARLENISEMYGETDESFKKRFYKYKKKIDELEPKAQIKQYQKIVDEKSNEIYHDIINSMIEIIQKANTDVGYSEIYSVLSANDRVYGGNMTNATSQVHRISNSITQIYSFYPNIPQNDGNKAEILFQEGQVEEGLIDSHNNESFQEHTRKALEKYNEAAKENHVRAIGRLGHLLAYSRNSEQVDSQSNQIGAQLLQIAANCGDRESAFECGKLALYADPQANIEIARDWFIQSHSMGHPDAAYMVGYCYHCIAKENNEHRLENLQEALKWFEIGSQQNDKQSSEMEEKLKKYLVSNGGICENS